MGKKTKTSPQPWELRQKRGRRFKVLALRKKYLIVTNGETEAAYLENYRGTTGPKIRIVRRLKDPCLLVKKAIAEREIRAKKGEVFHETWIVMDRDKFVANNGDEQQFQVALKSAQDNGIEVAYSDDAFELWYVLHYQDVNAATTRKDLVKLLEKHRSQRYEKGAKGDLYHEILHLRDVAIQRAHKLLKAAEGKTPTVNPCTRVHLLVEKLIENDPRLSK